MRASPGHLVSKNESAWSYGRSCQLRRLRVRTKARSHEYQIIIGRGILAAAGTEARRALGKPARRIALISNQQAFSLYGPAVIKSLKASGFSVSPQLIGDGEHFKSLKTAEQLLQVFSDIELERTDAVVALGGGVVSDLAGFAAAIYLRGISLILIPTTLLSQIDSSVGGKTGVNLPSGKNLVGSFHQPSLVITDVATLATLPARELVAGWCECVKQGAVASRKLFQQTTDFLTEFNAKKLLSSPDLEELVALHCAFKASIVAADEREEVGRSDRRSRRILNFGHTVAHALEAVTGYRRFRHGEAVGHGMLVAGELSKNLGLLKQTELELLRRAVQLCGPLPQAGDLDLNQLIDMMRRDKKSAAGEIRWVLLERIGSAHILDGREISSRLLKRSLSDGLSTN